MTKKEFSAKILRCSYSLWRAVLVGDRNLGYKKAQLASQIFVTPIEIWIDPKRQAERKTAWDKFNA
jgi:hypothetical protein